MSGLIATPTRPGAARHNAFFRMRDRIKRPDGTRQEIYEGFFSHRNKNAAVEEALAENRPWIFFIDDDQILEPDALMRLLAHDLDIVGVNLLTKDPPFQPYLFDVVDGRGAGWPETLETQRGVHQMTAMGMGGVLIKTDVFRRLPEPWFHVNEYLQTDDMYFFHQCNLHSIPVHVDFDVVSGHIPTWVSVWPAWDEDKGCWRTRISFNDNEYLIRPSPRGRSGHRRRR